MIFRAGAGQALPEEGLLLHSPPEIIFLRLPQEHAPVQVVFRHAKDGHADDADERQQAKQMTAQKKEPPSGSFPGTRSCTGNTG